MPTVQHSRKRFPFASLPQEFSGKSAPLLAAEFDDLDKTKMSQKQARRGRFAGFGGFGGAFSNFHGYGEDSSDEETTAAKPAGCSSAGRRVTIGGEEELGSSDDAFSDGEDRTGYRRATAAVNGLAVDLRTASGLPDGVEVVGGEASFEEQEDGDKALLVPEGAYLKVALPGMSSWMLEDDGRLHDYTLLMAVRLDRLPSAAMPLFNGGAPPTPHEPVDSVYLYKNGGVGALGQMGVREAAVRAERWAWIVVTRRKTELNTYVNGRHCSKVDVTVTQPKTEGGEGADGKPTKGKAKSGDGDGNGGGASKDKDKKNGVRVPERLTIDPQHLALFPPATVLHH